MRRLSLFAAAFGLLVASQIRITEADHNVFLPAIPTTVMNRVMDTGRVTYALDTVTSSYPNFRTQARDVVQADVGDGREEVTRVYTEIYCDVQHVAEVERCLREFVHGCWEDHPEWKVDMDGPNSDLWTTCRREDEEE